MPALGAGIHDLKGGSASEIVDGRDKPGHDEWVGTRAAWAALFIARSFNMRIRHDGAEG